MDRWRIRRPRAGCRRRGVARRDADRATASDRVRGRPHHGAAPRARRPCPDPAARGAQIERGGGADQFDGKDAAKVVDASTELASGRPAVGDVVFLHRARRQRLSAGRHGEALVLHRHCRLGVVGDHHPAVHAGIGREEWRQPVRASDVEQTIGAALADGRELARSDCEEVADERHRGAVEVAAALHPAVGKDHRVVDRRVELAFGDGPCMGDRVECGAVHLRGAAERVGVLHLSVTGAVAGNQG